MTFVRDYFLSKFDIYSKIIQPKKNHKLSNVFYIFYRCNSAKTLINYLYKDADLYLERKFKLARQSLTIEMKHRKNYTENENQIIRQYYRSLPKDKILSKLPNRSYLNLQNQARILGIHKYNIKNKLCV